MAHEVHAFDLHLELVRNAGRWKNDIPDIDFGRVSKLRRMLLEDCGPVAGLGVAEGFLSHGDKAGLAACCKRWKQVKDLAEDTLPYLSSKGRVGEDFAHLWTQFCSALEGVCGELVLWRNFLKSCADRYLACRDDKVSYLKQFINDDVEWAHRNGDSKAFLSRVDSIDKLRNRPAEHDIVDMDIELLLSIAERRVDSVSTLIQVSQEPQVRSVATSTDKYTDKQENTEECESDVSKEEGKTKRRRCGECKNWISAKSEVATCSFHKCGKYFHLSCVGNLNKVPAPWFCKACVGPTLAISGALDNLAQAPAGEKERAKPEANAARRKEIKKEKSHEEQESDEPRRKRQRRQNAASSGGSNSSINKNANTGSSKECNNAKESKSVVVQPPNRQSPHQTTIADLVKAGFLKKGDKISVPYLNKHLWQGVINKNGLVELEGLEFYSPPSLALFCKRKIYKSKQSDRGWTSCFHGKTPLLTYRNLLIERQRGRRGKK